MADRLLMGDGKLVVSKAGKDASDPLLTPGDMMFNSDWLFSGAIIAAGVHVDASSYALSPYSYAYGYRDQERTTDSYTQVINFPPQSYIPTVTLIPLGDPRYWNGFGMLLWGNNQYYDGGNYSRGAITITTSQIIIPRVVWEPEKTFKSRESFIYIVMGM